MAKATEKKKVKSATRLPVGVLGASGYTGAELLRLLSGHEGVDVAFLTADRHAGKPMASVFPHLGHLALPDLITLDEVDWNAAEVIFCALPHGTTQEVIKSLFAAAPGKKVVDLSADFRLSDLDVYEEWYGHAHKAPDLQTEAVYGLSEIHRDAIRETRLCANPGCYTTTSELPLIPLLAEGLIAKDEIIIDAKSGVSGAGRSERQGNLHSEVSEGTHAYGIGSHRHAPEIDQELSLAAGSAVTVSFTPHLMPMNRGILATIYVRLNKEATVDDLRDCLAKRYRDEPFVHVLADGAPATRDVRGTNQCRIGVCADRLPGRAILVSVTDNLVKGASGQAIQNMNLMCGLPETQGLEQAALFP
ncbi:MAG: N-acetyl-gamma-glutamyl-phosphate reductase [Rhodospirillaceae bacterium]|nr:N-acetyl-gamma-glutamyl-phosphate reductase [Rhodospirillaceae bacterium]